MKRLLYKKNIRTDEADLESLQVISFHSWILWCACTLALVSLLVWSFTAIIETHQLPHNKLLTIHSQSKSAQTTLEVQNQAPIALAFPLLKRWHSN